MQYDWHWNRNQKLKLQKKQESRRKTFSEDLLEALNSGRKLFVEQTSFYIYKNEDMRFSWGTKIWIYTLKEHKKLSPVLFSKSDSFGQ